MFVLIIQLQGLSNRNGKILHVTKLIHVNCSILFKFQRASI